MTLPNAIFDWILSAGLRASLLVPIVLAAQWLLRNRLPATWRYALWSPVLVALLVPALPILPRSAVAWSSPAESSAASPVVEAIKPPDLSDQPAPPEAPDTRPATGMASASAGPPAENQMISGSSAVSPEPAGSIGLLSIPPADPPARIDWRAVALWAWLGGALAVGLSILASFVVTMRRVKRSALPVNPDLLARVAHLASAAGLRRAPRVRRSSGVSSPAVCGLWRPVLLINERFEEELSEEETELILRHELAHIRRGDLPLNALQCVLLALHWFNPLLWLAFFRARADREAACDEAVLRGEPAPRCAAYGHTLLKMETRCAPAGLCLGFVGILQGRGTLRARIQSIIARRKLNAVTAAAVATGIAVFALVGITGVGAEPEGPRTYPPTDGDFVKNLVGRGTAKVWGIQFDVEEPKGGTSSSKFEGGLHSDPGKTDARHVIKLGGDVSIRLQKVPGSPISFQFNGEDYGALEVGDRVVIAKDRRVTVNKQPRWDPDFRPVWRKWQKDIAAFDAELQKLAATAKIPDEEDLKKRLESRTGEVEVITDGYGGVVDFNAAEGTVQHEANKKFAGPYIDWQFELAGDTKISHKQSTRLLPEIARVANDGKEEGEAFRFEIRIAKTDDGPFKAGDRVRLRASIDDFSRFRKGFTEAMGLVAIYHLEDSPNPVFSLKLDEAEINLIKAADAEEGDESGGQRSGAAVPKALRGLLGRTPPEHKLTFGTHTLMIVDSSGKPYGGTSGTHRDDVAGTTTHTFDSANGRYKITLVNDVLTINGEKYTLSKPASEIRIVDDRVEINGKEQGKRLETLPNLAHAFPGEPLFSQTNFEGIQSFSYATDLPFEELKQRLVAHLGKGWKEAGMDPSAMEEAQGKDASLLGHADFTNPALPKFQISLTQIKQDVEGKKSAAVITLAKLPERPER